MVPSLAEAPDGTAGNVRARCRASRRSWLAGSGRAIFEIQPGGAIAGAADRCIKSLVLRNRAGVEVGMFDLRRAGIITLQPQRQRQVMTRARGRSGLDTQLRQLGDGLVIVAGQRQRDRKSTRLNSSHQIISYAVFCLKKKTTIG